MNVQFTSSGDHQLPKGHFDQSVKKPATELCKKVGGIAAGTIASVVISLVAYWFASSKAVTCYSQNDDARDCAYIYAKCMIASIALAIIFGYAVFKKISKF